MSSTKRAKPDHPIHEFLAERWSPYAFADRAVSDADLRSLFEAARWAPSSYNEQPWSYIVATKADEPAFKRLLSCLNEGNRVWARAAPVLALGVVRHNFTRNHEPNRAATHDLGLASENLVIEATSRGLVVHQMIGIHPDVARKEYGIPEQFEAWTGLAIGYRGESSALPEHLRPRDESPRHRKPLAEFVFGEAWGKPANVVSK